MFLILLLAIIATLAPQQKPAPARPAPQKRAVKAPCPTQAEADTCARGRQLLQAAEAEAAGLAELGMRGYVLLQVARAYAGLERAKALDLLDQAFTAAASLPEDSESRPRLQEQVLNAIANVNPAHVDELISQVPADVRQKTLKTLVAYYQEHNQVNRAIAIINRLGAEGSFPYGAAGRLMEGLPSDSPSRLQLFTAAVTSFQNQKPAEFTAPMGDSDFGDMVAKNWQGLPPVLVHDAIDQILSRAESADSSLELTMFGRDGSLAFNSAYEWRLFQLLPVLRRLDEAAAEELLKKNERLKQQFQRFPQGMQSWYAKPDQPSVNGTVLTTRDSNAPRTGSPAPPARVTQMLEMVEQINRALRDVREHPHESLGIALGIADDSTRLRTLILVARATQKNSPNVCKSALDKVVEQSDRVPPHEGANALVDAGRLYLKIEDKDSVKKVIERGGALAEKLYQTDTDSDDPNEALKAYWPSVNAWTNFARLAAEVSPEAALKMVNDITDDEIRPVIRVALAASWLGAPSGSAVVLSDTKKGFKTMDGRGSEQ